MKSIWGSGTSTCRAGDSGTMGQDCSAGQEQRGAPAVQSGSLSKHTALYNQSQGAQAGAEVGEASLTSQRPVCLPSSAHLSCVAVSSHLNLA